jgi:hypothetical protein
MTAPPVQLTIFDVEGVLPDSWKWQQTRRDDTGIPEGDPPTARQTEMREVTAAWVAVGGEIA